MDSNSLASSPTKHISSQIYWLSDKRDTISFENNFYQTTAMIIYWKIYRLFYYPISIRFWKQYPKQRISILSDSDKKQGMLL